MGLRGLSTSVVSRTKEEGFNLPEGRDGFKRLLRFGVAL